MAQPFDCLCGAPSCRGTIAGARDMTPAQLEGVWLNGHIRELLDEKNSSINSAQSTDPTTRALREALIQAEKVVEAARVALSTYVVQNSHELGTTRVGGSKVNGFGTNGALGSAAGLNRRGPTSRELSGEMGGDTIRV